MTQASNATNVDADELSKFSALASTWWDPKGKMGPLHDINPLRVDYIAEARPLSGLRVADIGCGGGLLSEALAKSGAQVTGIDLAHDSINVAKAHAAESGLDIDYRLTSAEDLAAELPGQFDLVCALEMLEHVPDPASVVSACAALCKPGGEVVMSTINRTPKAFAFAIVGAEYVLQMLPRGTHDYAKFIRPSELSRWARNAGLQPTEIMGLTYNPLTRTYAIKPDSDVNYFLRAQKR